MKVRWKTPLPSPRSASDIDPGDDPDQWALFARLAAAVGDDVGEVVDIAGDVVAIQWPTYGGGCRSVGVPLRLLEEVRE